MYKILIIGDNHLNSENELEKYIYNSGKRNVNIIHISDRQSNLTQYSNNMWVIDQIVNSDIIVFELPSTKPTNELIYLLGLLHYINHYTNKHIQIVGFGEEELLSSFLQCEFNSIYKTIDDLADYIINYLII